MVGVALLVLLLLVGGCGCGEVWWCLHVDFPERSAKNCPRSANYPPVFRTTANYQQTKGPGIKRYPQTKGVANLLLGNQREIINGRV